jgi:hypothetical protein
MRPPAHPAVSRVFHCQSLTGAAARRLFLDARGQFSDCLFDHCRANAGSNSMPDQVQPQLLHLVLGGELTDLEHVTFKDLDKVDIVGVFPNYATAYAAWRAKAQQTVDNAQMRYFIVHLHRLLDPATDTKR